MFSFLQSLILTILLAFMLRFFVIQPFVVEGSSMEPNFHDKQYIIIDKLSYRFRDPKRGEVVVLHPPVQPNENYIKRLVGLPGETIRIQEGNVYVNDSPLNEPYLGEQRHTTEAFSLTEPVTLGVDEYFVMGDNRGHSSDSREWGKLKAENIEGRTWFIALPVKDFEFVKAPAYDGTNTSLQLYNHLSRTF